MRSASTGPAARIAGDGSSATAAAQRNEPHQRGGRSPGSSSQVAMPTPMIVRRPGTADKRPFAASEARGRLAVSPVLNSRKSTPPAPGRRAALGSFVRASEKDDVQQCQQTSKYEASADDAHGRRAVSSVISVRKSDQGKKPIMIAST